MVDIVDIIMSKLLFFLLGIAKTIKMCIEEIYKYIKTKQNQKKKVNSKYLKYKTKVFTKHQYEKVKRRHNIENANPNVHIIPYREKSNNNNKRKNNGFFVS